MLEFRGKIGLPALSGQVLLSGDDQVRRFLVESERRVAMHCRKQKIRTCHKKITFD
jgi:hypothetical protein